ncbi:MAG: TonB-dependent receptor [Opitutae bacterium]|nr:TonB-dependent receptor [Opitutae bacterium]
MLENQQPEFTGRKKTPSILGIVSAAFLLACGISVVFAQENSPQEAEKVATNDDDAHHQPDDNVAGNNPDSHHQPTTNNDEASSHHQPDSRDNNAVSGEPVLVEATRREGRLLDAPMSVSVVEGDDIFNSSSGTLSDALSSVPGVQTESPGSMFKQINIRGEDNQRVLILVDGEKISEQKGLNGSPILVSLQDIDRVEVIKGPASVLYGSDAIGGVVNIFTKKDAAPGFHGSAGIRADSGTNGFEQFYDLGLREDGVFFRAQYSNAYHGDIRAPDGKVDNTDCRFTSFSVLAGYDISENATLKLKLENFRGHSGVHIDQKSAAAAVPGTKSMAMDLPEWDRTKASASFDWKDISEVFVKLRLSGYYQYTKKRFLQNVGLDTGSPYAPQAVDVNTENKLDVVGAEIQADFELPAENYLIAGASFEYDALRANQTTETVFASGNSIHGGGRDKAKIFTASIYASDEWNFAEGWKLVVGARGTYYENDLKAGGAIADGEPHDYDDLHATFSLSLVNTQLENWAFRGIVAQGYRYGTANELYIGSAALTPWTNAASGSGTMTPNPDLKPESSTNFELGARYSGENFNLDLAGFYTFSDDYIAIVERESSSGTTANYVENLDSCRTFGVEAAASYDIKPDSCLTISPYITGTFLRRRYENDGHSTYKNNQPQLFGKIGTRGKWRSATGTLAAWCDLNLRMSDEAKSDASEGIPGWATLNFSVGIDLRSTGSCEYFRKLSLCFGVDNILDKGYRLPAKFPYDLNIDPYEQVGRSFWVALKYEF